MAGKFNDVRSKIQNKYPYAVYIHCMVHRVDLAVIDMCRFVKVRALKILFTYLYRKLCTIIFSLRKLKVYLIHWTVFMVIFPIRPKIYDWLKYKSNWAWKLWRLMEERTIRGGTACMKTVKLLYDVIRKL